MNSENMRLGNPRKRVRVSAYQLNTLSPYSTIPTPPYTGLESKMLHLRSKYLLFSQTICHSRFINVRDASVPPINRSRSISVGDASVAPFAYTFNYNVCSWKTQGLVKIDASCSPSNRISNLSRYGRPRMSYCSLCDPTSCLIILQSPAQNSAASPSLNACVPVLVLYLRSDLASTKRKSRHGRQSTTLSSWRQHYPGGSGCEPHL